MIDHVFITSFIHIQLSQHLAAAESALALPGEQYLPSARGGRRRSRRRPVTRSLPGEVGVTEDPLLREARLRKWVRARLSVHCYCSRAGMLPVGRLTKKLMSVQA